MECVALVYLGIPQQMTNFQFISYFFTILEISLLIRLSFEVFSRDHTSTLNS
jgi:hypothetical protein